MRSVLGVVLYLSTISVMAEGPQPRGDDVPNQLLRSLDIWVHESDDPIRATVKEQRFVSSVSQHVAERFGIGDSIVLSVSTEVSRAPEIPGKSRVLKVHRFSVDNPRAEAFLHGAARSSLLLNDGGDQFRFPETILDFVGGVLIYRSGDETVFTSLKAPEGKVVPLSSAFSFIVNSIPYPGGAYLLTDQGIVVNIPSQIVALGKRLDVPTEPTYHGLRLEGILAANYDRRDGFDSDFEKWLDNNVRPYMIGSREVVRRAVLIEELGKLVDVVVHRGPGDPECTLRKRFMVREATYINQYPSSSSIPDDAVPIDAAIKVLLDLRKIHSQIQEAPVSMREFLGDCHCDDDFILRSNSVYSFTPGADRILPLDMDNLRNQHCLALMQKFAPLVRAVDTSLNQHPSNTPQRAIALVNAGKSAVVQLQAQIERKVQEFSSVKAITDH